MAHRGTGLWLGAALVAASACSHTSQQARNDNAYANQPVAAQTATPPSGDNAGTTGPSGTTGASGDQGAAGENTTAQGDNGSAATGSTADNGAPAGTGAPSDQASQNPGGSGTSSGSNSGEAAHEQGSGSENPAAEAETTTRDKNAVIASSDGSQLGVVQNYANGTLTLASEGRKSHHSSHVRSLTIGENVPVFQGTSRVSADALVPGADVRVYYRNPESGSERQVIGVDILNGQQGSPAPAGSEHQDTEPGSNPHQD